MKMVTRTFIISSLAICMGVAHSEESCTPGHSQDFGWIEHQPERRLKDDVARLNAMLGDRATQVDVELVPGRAVDATGQKDEDGGVRHWVYGAYQEGKTCEKNRSWKSTYLVQYAIVKLSFTDAHAVSCEVLRRTIISDVKAPDPFTSFSISERKTSCSKFNAN
jgi:hypothetical protein